jgi:tetratricopeptide (TPR) repeat protein
MKSIAPVVLVSLVICGAAAAALWKSPCSDCLGSPAARAPEEVGQLRRRVEAIEEAQRQTLRRQQALEAQLEEALTARRGAAAAPAGAAEAEPVPASAAVADGEDGGEVDAQAEARRAKLEPFLETIVDSGTAYAEKQAAWRQIASAGLLDDAVAFFEARVEEDPTKSRAHVDLGHAYIQKLLTVNDGEKGALSMKADASYTKALELDPRHWEARFSKAVNYSFVPPVFGLQPKAIEEFEVLRAQQEEGEAQPHYKQTYELLGNLYANMGKAEKAREVWQRGSALFPDDVELRKKSAEPEKTE